MNPLNIIHENELEILGPFNSDEIGQPSVKIGI